MPDGRIRLISMASYADRKPDWLQLQLAKLSSDEHRDVERGLQDDLRTLSEADGK